MMRILVKLLRRMKPFRLQYGLVCLFGLVIALLEMIPPRLIGKTIDLMAGSAFQMRPILETAGIWAILVGINQFLHSHQILIANRSGERVLAQLRQEIFDKIQRLPISYFDRTHVGQVLARSGSDLDALRNLLIWGLNTFFANSILVLCAATMIFVTDWRLFVSVIWLVPTMTLLNSIYGNRVTAAWRQAALHSAKVGSNQAENIAGAKVVAAFNRQEENLVFYNSLQKSNTAHNVSAARLSGVFRPLLQWVRFLGQAIILLYGGYRVASGSLNPGNLVAVSLYWEWLMHPAMNFGALFNDLLIGGASAQRIFELLDDEPEVVDLPGAVSLPSLQGLVRFEHVDFRYPSGPPVLQDVDFEVKSGQTIALVGGTGSGKSTIISLLARFHHPIEGRVLLDGYDLREVESSSLRSQIATVLQSNFLFRGSVMENLKYARPGASEEEIFGAARELGCHERFLRLKNGYHTDVGEGGSALSLGERQLVCFTRALIANPRLLLLDEATSAIDPITESQVRRALERLVRSRTTFIVAHRLQTILHADLILVLEKGRIVERGTRAELLALRGKFYQLQSLDESANDRTITAAEPRENRISP